MNESVAALQRSVDGVLAAETAADQLQGQDTQRQLAFYAQQYHNEPYPRLHDPTLRWQICIDVGLLPPLDYMAWPTSLGRSVHQTILEADRATIQQYFIERHGPLGMLIYPYHSADDKACYSMMVRTSICPGLN
jgi:hypothetical protein